ncbi:MAG: tetratricopeptide repeat protein [Acidobacteria bacterium]|nr:tetratricopeptide repeat protein [Acidobacteriota bacterium]MCI0626328.1 tetratricopeptide repeat protein [Acidobacteriota bacterium]MCI0718513.1 tetratricopeptide repeat protein [Acidobacteriota bacterium]
MSSPRQSSKVLIARTEISEGSRSGECTREQPGRARARRIRPLALKVMPLAMACGLVLMTGACVHKIRAVNDNFYVINRSGKPPKLSFTHDLRLAPKSPRPLDSIETSESQASSRPRPKSLLSNAEILEDENSEMAALLRKVKSDPANAGVHSQLGRAYHEFRIYDEALWHYQKAIQLEPENPGHYEQAGRLWRDWQSPQQGVSLVQKALELEPDFVEAWNTLGTLFDRLGNRRQAQEAYLQALSHDPGLDYVHNNLCFSYLQDGRFEQAVQHGERATQLNPSMLVAHNNLGLAYGMRGDLVRSLEEFSQTGDEAAARNNLGLMLLNWGQFAESMEQFRLAARLRPHYRVAASNYRSARDLKFQQERASKDRMRAFDHETGLAVLPGSLGLVALKEAGLNLLSGPLELLSALPVLAPSLVPPASPIVEVEVESLGGPSQDGRILGGLLGNECLFLTTRTERTRTVVYYRPGYLKAALELAHSIPGNQTVLETSPSEQNAGIRVLLP